MESPEAAAAAAETLPGYDAGYAAGFAAAASAQDAIDAALVQSIEDLSFGFAEARQFVLQGLTPFFETLADLILPASVDPTFRVRLIEQLQTAVQTDAKQPCQLVLHPDQVASVQNLLRQIAMTDVTVTGWADQPLHAALIRRGPVETAIDADAVLDGLKDILTAFFDMTEERSHHG